MNYKKLWLEEQVRKETKQKFPNLTGDQNYDGLINKEVNKALNSYNWSKYLFSLKGFVVGMIIAYIVASALKSCQ